RTSPRCRRAPRHGLPARGRHAAPAARRERRPRAVEGLRSRCLGCAVDARAASRAGWQDTRGDAAQPGGAACRRASARAHARWVARVTVSLWRIAADTPLWTAEDMAGKGAAHKGARWNHAGEHVIYAAPSVSLAAWETRAHF